MYLLCAGNKDPSVQKPSTAAYNHPILLPIHLYHTLDLEEATQPPDLEERLADDNADDKQVPPLHAGVGALGGVAVGAFADDNVALLILDLGEEFGEELDCWSVKLVTTRTNWPLRDDVQCLPSFSSGS